MPPNPAGATRPTPTVGRLEALKFREPVRLYLWPAIAVAVVALAVDVGTLWADSLIDGFAVALLIAATAAARASVFTVPGIRQAIADGERPHGG
jgi:hypothetical protein